MTFLLALVVFVVIVAVMAVGVIFGRPPIKGSCGGLGAIGIDQECEICGGDPQRCDSSSDAVPVRQYDPNSADASER
jgi:hypothetical protein